MTRRTMVAKEWRQGILRNAGHCIRRMQSRTIIIVVYMYYRRRVSYTPEAEVPTPLFVCPHLLTIDFQPITSDRFEWSSDSDEALGRKLTFSLSSYASLTAMEFVFPEGDTYSFDLHLYDGQVSRYYLDPTSSFEPHTTIEVRSRW